MWIAFFTCVIIEAFFTSSITAILFALLLHVQKHITGLLRTGEIGLGLAVHLSAVTADEAQTVSASTEEETASMHEIADASRKLAEQAQDLQNAIAVFKI